MSWTIHRYDVVESTNDVAARLLESREAVPPFVVIADRQTHGRGRGTNSWWSDEGSLTATLAFDPVACGLSPIHEPRIALATAVAIIEAISWDLPDSRGLGIRWPNDIESGGRKLGGMLPERVESQAGPRLLIGVGVNIRTRLAAAPDEIGRMAVSLDQLRSSDVSPIEFLDAVLARLDSILPRLGVDDERLAKRWAELDTLRGETVRVDLGTSIVTGIGCGIDAEGALVLMTEDGKVRLFGGRVLRDYK